MKINPKFLPSKRFVLSLSLALVIIIITIIITFFKENLYTSKNKSIVGLSASSTLEAFKQQDTDGDNLPDWQETLYGTDPKKADTDGDGTNDEDEMKANRDPLKANTATKGQEPNDKIDPKIIEQINKANIEYENLNDTEKFARNFMSQYIASQPVGRQMTQAEQDNIVSQMLAGVEPETLAPHFLEKDLNIVAKPKLEELLKYVKDISAILKNEITPNVTKSFDIVSNLSEGDNYVGIKKLNPIIDQLTISANKIIKLKVASDASAYHLNFANNAYRLVEHLNYIKLINSDPLKSMKGLQGYSAVFSELGTDFETLTEKIFLLMQTS
jgi:hypothetical protein